MDPVTHALSGATLALALPATLRTRWMPLWAALVAACPDIDVFFTKTPLEYILWHRGITHSLVGAAILAVPCALPLLFGRKQIPDTGQKSTQAAPLSRWTFGAAWFFSFLLLLLHIWLDCTNSYGTQVFLPFSAYRVRLSGLFIVDALLVIPYLCGVLFFRGKRTVQVALLIWSLLYPAGACMVRPFLEHRLHSELPPVMNGERVEAVHLTPDVGAPLFWKSITDTRNYRLVAPYIPFSPPREGVKTFAKPPEPLWSTLAQNEYSFHAYEAFSQFPVLEYAITETDGTRVAVFTDVRFGSAVSFVNRIQRTDEPDRDNTFRIMARIDRDGRLAGVRFRTVRGAGGRGDSGWQEPHPWPPTD